MAMDQAMEDLNEKMKQTDEKLDVLALQVGNIENEIFANHEDPHAEIEVNNLLKSVNEVKNNYQNLRKDLVEVQDLQKQLSTSLQIQLRMMQAKFNTLKEKIGTTQQQIGNSSATKLTTTVAPSTNYQQHQN